MGVSLGLERQFLASGSGSVSRVKRYANLEAAQLHDAGKRFSGLRAIFKLMFYFWGTYIGLGGFRGGWPGLFISVQIAYFKFSIEARLWEYENNRSLDEIEIKYDELKESLLANERIRP